MAKSVFHDLFPAEEAAELEMRAKLLAGINKWLNGSGLTQVEAAKRLGITQARVSEIKNGKINRFSLSMLVRLAERAGLRPYDVITTFEGKGIVLRFEPEQTLCHTQLSSVSRLPDEPQSYSTLCFALASAATRTSVTLTIDNFPTETIFKHLNFYWSTTLEIFKRFVEQRETPNLEP